MTDVAVALGERSYRISIGARLLASAGERLQELTRNRRVVIVADERVAALHLPALRRGLAPIAADVLLVAGGEESKSFRSLEALVDQLLALELTRADVLLAFGGGVVGDLAGFAAAILKRGLSFVQIPTTLLAMVDSSVGGKTGINTRAGKNLVGAFHQPLAVWADTSLLETLPGREMQAGYAEIVKYGLIADPEFYFWCEANAARLLAHDAAALSHAIAVSCQTKAAIVAADERETTGTRALLNFGHTFGHALEAETGFSGQLLHGEAVGIGMAQALRFSARLGLAPPDDARRLETHLKTLAMRAFPAEAGIAADAAPRLLHHMRNDKKRGPDGLPFILSHGIGQAFLASGVPLDKVEEFLAGDLAKGPGTNRRPK